MSWLCRYDLCCDLHWWTVGKKIHDHTPTITAFGIHASRRNIKLYMVGARNGPAMWHSYISLSISLETLRSHRACLKFRLQWGNGLKWKIFSIFRLGVCRTCSRLVATKGWFKVVGIYFIMFNVYRFVIK